MKGALEGEVEHLKEALQEELDELKEAVAVPLKHKEPGPVVGTDAATFMTTPASVGADAVFNKRLKNGEERFLYCLMHEHGDLQEYPIPFPRPSQGNQDFILFEIFLRLGVWERRIVTSSNSVSTVQIGGVQAPMLKLCSSVVGEDSCSTLITVMLTLIYN